MRRWTSERADPTRHLNSCRFICFFHLSPPLAGSVMCSDTRPSTRERYVQRQRVCRRPLIKRVVWPTGFLTIGQLVNNSSQTSTLLFSSSCSNSGIVFNYIIPDRMLYFVLSSAQHRFLGVQRQENDNKELSIYRVDWAQNDFDEKRERCYDNSS